MKIVKARSFPRAGFLGNPSDGYFGKTMSFAFADYCVDLTLTESAKMRFVPGEVDDATFDSPKNLVRDIRLYGYYGGIRMLKAVAKLFFEYCFDHGIDLPEQNFTAEYRTNIPRLVGLSGSSAICSAMLKALMKFYSVDIPLEFRCTMDWFSWTLRRHLSRRINVGDTRDWTRNCCLMFMWHLIQTVRRKAGKRIGR